jgi:hypothetical protein
MLLHTKSNAIERHLDTISFKGRYYHIKIVSLSFYFFSPSIFQKNDKSDTRNTPFTFIYGEKIVLFRTSILYLPHIYAAKAPKFKFFGRKNGLLF